MSYINRKRAGKTGTNRTTQVEISNLLRLTFPGRVKPGECFTIPGLEMGGRSNIAAVAAVEQVRDAGLAKYSCDFGSWSAPPPERQTGGDAAIDSGYFCLAEGYLLAELLGSTQ